MACGYAAGGSLTRSLHPLFWHIYGFLQFCRCACDWRLATYLDQLLAYLPAEYPGVLLPQLVNPRLDLRGGHLRFGPTYHARPNGARLLVSVQDLRHTAVGDAQLAGNHTGTNSTGRHFHDLQANVIGQRATVDEDAPELVDATLSCDGVNEIELNRSFGTI